jgi:hypothetical protein
MEQRLRNRELGRRGAERDHKLLLRSQSAGGDSHLRRRRLYRFKFDFPGERQQCAGMGKRTDRYQRVEKHLNYGRSEHRLRGQQHHDGRAEICSRIRSVRRAEQKCRAQRDHDVGVVQRVHQPDGRVYGFCRQTGNGSLFFGCQGRFGTGRPVSRQGVDESQPPLPSPPTIHIPFIGRARAARTRDNA